MRRRVFLLRHAEVSYFKEDGTPVRDRTVPLTPKGREQAAAAAQALAKEKIDRLVCSGLPRTVETAEIVRSGRALDLEVIADFEEVRSGGLKDLTPEKAEALFVGAFKIDDPRSAKFLGGESFAELEARVIPAWERLHTENSWEVLLLVAHGAVNRVILAHALGTGAQIYGKLEQDPACINVIDVARPGATGPRARTVVRAINVTPYNIIKEGIQDTTMEALWRAFLGKRNQT